MSTTVVAASAAAPDTSAERPGSIARLALLASIAISFLAASAAPSPLYQHYDLVWHGTALTTTEAFGVYAFAVLAGLLLLGEASAHIGRRPVLLASLALQAASVLLFATAGSFEPLFVGRVLQGIAAGAALGTLGAAMIEAHRSHGTVASAAAPAAGTGIGALVAGLTVSFLPWPTHLVYVGLAGVFALQAIGVVLLVEANQTRPGLLSSLRPTLAVPASARGAFMAAAPAVFAVWALAGLYGSLGPALVRELSGSGSAALGGLAIFVLAGAGSGTTVLRRTHEARAQLTGGIAALVLGVAVTVVAVAAGSLWVFLVGTFLSGIGFGSGLQGAIRGTVGLVAAEERPGLLSAIYLVCYAGMGAPAVIAGFLISRGLDLTEVTIGYGVGLILLALLALAQLTLSRRTR
ncbi:MFS transporter [Nocardioides sp. BP30]|uniref:MFS transporter n=1 Tax=Nocardioides sp. BP30 TaxID=3036374 RepID=UPI00246985DB|nr:MFS transporter [Nocardioides sp. BP30]WGL53522.1 MFS transporter [Nocardioides sp. BP30]